MHPYKHCAFVVHIFYGQYFFNDGKFYKKQTNIRFFGVIFDKIGKITPYF